MRRIIQGLTIINRKTTWEATASNERFYEMAALPPLEKQYEIASVSPAGKRVRAATS